MSCTHTLKNGRQILIRSVTEADAPALKEYIRQAAAETDYLARGPEDFAAMTDADEAAFIRNFLNTPHSLLLCAEYQGNIVANAGLMTTTLTRTAHTAELGISVSQAFWGQGLGRALINEIIRHAKNSGTVEIIRLTARADNGRAIALYRSFGFRPAGLHRKMFKINGAYFNGLLMDLLL